MADNDKKRKRTEYEDSLIEEASWCAAMHWNRMSVNYALTWLVADRSYECDVCHGLFISEDVAFCPWPLDTDDEKRKGDCEGVVCKYCLAMEVYDNDRKPVYTCHKNGCDRDGWARFYKEGNNVRVRLYKLDKDHEFDPVAPHIKGEPSSKRQKKEE